MPSKSSHAGPTAAVKHRRDQNDLPPRLELPTVLNHERARYNRKRVGLQEVDDIARMWFTVYHSLVWLAAATNLQTEEEILTGDFTGFRIKNHHHVSAFYPQEADDDNASGWLYQEIRQTFKTIKQNNNVELGKRFPISVIQEVNIDGADQPLLKYFLDKIEPERLAPSSFDPDATFRACRASVSEMTLSRGYHANAQEYVKKALTSIKRLWKPVKKSHSDEIHGWLAEGAGSREWLEEKLQIPSLVALGIERFDSLSDEAKLSIGQKAGVLEQVTLKTFLLIYHRLIDEENSSDKNDGLAGVVEKVIKGIPDADKEAWRDLVAATYGVFAWTVFQQASAAVEEVRQIMEGG